MQVGQRPGVWLLAALLLMSAGCDRGSSSAPVSALGSAVPFACSPTSSPPLPDEDLKAAGLSEACLLTRLDLKATEGTHTLTLLGAYADPARTVMIVRVSPDDQGTPGPVNLTEDVEGGFNGGSGGFPASPGTPGGDYILYTNAGPQAMAGRIGSFKAHFMLGNPGPPGLNDPGVTIAFKLRVFRATPLQAPHPFQLGKWQVVIRVLEVTPAVIHVQALYVGARLEDIPMGPPPDDPITLLDVTGKTLLSMSGGSLEAQGASLDFQWIRPLEAGTYHLNFQIPGATHTETLKVPAMTIS